MNCTDNEHLIITVKSSPVKKTEETGAGLPVKDLFGGIEEEALVEFSPAISYQIIDYVEYILEFAGLNAMHGEDRRNQTALETAFKFWAMTSQALSTIEILLDVSVETKTKTLLRYTVKKFKNIIQ